MKKYWLSLFLFWLLSNTAFADRLNYPFSTDVQMQLTALESPSPLIANNKAYLVYEFYLTNFTNTPIKLLNLNISGQYGPTAESKVSFDFNGPALDSMLHFVGLPKIQSAPQIIDPGMKKIVYVMLEFKAPYQIPDTLIHRLTVQNTTPDGKNAKIVTMTEDPLLVKPRPPVVIGAPVSGDNWYVGNGPSNTSAHRSTYRVSSGSTYFAQRYALDLVKLGKDGRTYAGDISKNESYHCYKAMVHAVADGQIVAIHDGVPENTPNSGKLAIDLNLENVGGNYVVVNIGYHQYAFYAHMVPGSLKVKVGDIVKKGQSLGLLGNSGNSSEPHLHFHVVDGPSFLGANGVPYAFEKFSIQPSKEVANSALIQVQLLKQPMEEQHNQLVLTETFMKFPIIDMDNITNK